MKAHIIICFFALLAGLLTGILGIGILGAVAIGVLCGLSAVAVIEVLS